MAKKMSNWIRFVTAHYNKMKNKNPKYEFKDALKSAAKVYKKGKGSRHMMGGGSDSDSDDMSNAVEMDDTSSSSKMSGGSRKRRRSRKRSCKSRRTRRR